MFYNELDTVFKPKLAAALNVPISKVGKIVLPPVIILAEAGSQTPAGPVRPFFG